jgi:putative endonuclease
MRLPSFPHPTKGENMADEHKPGMGCEGRETAGSGEEAPTKPVDQMTPREIGTEGERLAAEFLERRGYQVLERNWRCAAGEVDIIALDDDCHVLVEVKTRLALGDASEDMPELAVDRRKRARYRKLALLYLASHPKVMSVRFDVIALNIVGDRTARLRHLIGAFEWTE